MMHAQASSTETAGVARRAAVRMVGAWIALPLFFLVTGGTLAWWEAWAYCLVVLAPMTAFVSWMMRRDREFLARRMETREKERTQKHVIAFGIPLLLATYVVPGLDHRLGWSEVPLPVVVAAQLLVLAGYLFVLRVFQENRWAGRTVETSPEQRVVSTGPYALVRHPMYLGTTLLYLATPLALGSWWALLPALAFVLIFVFRIRNEEEVLMRELPGYEEYRKKVRFRLIPFVW